MKEDRISNLSDDLLAFILSFLTVREAAGTSVLARRWRYVWICISSLDFDDNGTLTLEIRDNEVLLAQLRTKYVNWVNRVLAIHSGPSISQFRVCFDLDKSFESTTHEWLKFALSKRIQSLELDLSGGCICSGDDYSSFPDSIFSQRERFVGFQSVKSLSFHSVDVTGKIVDCFLSCSPSLERISIRCSHAFGSLRIVRPSIPLKYLELYALFETTAETIEICDSNLMYLSYTGGEINLLLKNVPYLVEVHIGGGICWDLNDVFSRLSCCLSQLEVLSLGLQSVDMEDLTKLDKVPYLPKLKHLTLQIEARKDASFLRFTTLLKGCPHLEQLVLHLEWRYDTARLRKKLKSLKCRAYQHLKVVEFRGYYGRLSDLEFVMHFIKHAVVLEKIIIDPHCPRGNFEEENERIARSFALQQLPGIEPVGVELLIL